MGFLQQAMAAEPTAFVHSATTLERHLLVDTLLFVSGSMRAVSELSKLKVQQNTILEVRQPNNCTFIQNKEQ